MESPFLKVEALSKTFYVRHHLWEKSHVIKAVDGINFTLNEGEVLGIIGESGSGKSTLGELLLRLQEPSEGRIDYLKIEGNFRKNIQIVQQQSSEVFDPLMSVEKIVLEAIKKHHKLGKSEQEDRLMALLTSVGLSPEDRYKKINQFSGGQLQRICIARALAVSPKMLLLDEPVSALDVSVQGQIINLLMTLKEKHHLTYIIISHDLNIIKHMCNRIAVMHRGQFVEVAKTQKIFNAPEHAYTKALVQDFVGVPDQIAVD
jgi:ABC-type oligopeptide transport system ATPase subunit